MRKERTPEEIQTIQFFLPKLQEIIQQPVSLDPNHIDVPDFILQMGDVKIGCEISGLYDQQFVEILKYLIKKTPPGTKSRIVIDNKPQLILEKIIDQKKSKINNYIKKAGEKIWLILDPGNTPNYQEDENTIAQFIETAYCIGHSFERIYFCNRNGEKLILIYDKDIPYKAIEIQGRSPFFILEHIQLSLENHKISLEEIPVKYEKHILLEKLNGKISKKIKIPFQIIGINPETKVALLEKNRIVDCVYTTNKNGNLMELISAKYIGKRLVIRMRKYGYLEVEKEFVVKEEGIYFRNKKK